jgi:creatinine amidohydrolase/Fe(II)-dependent formamide hydrolase-like protein
MQELDQYLPTRINQGSFVTSYSWPVLAERVAATTVVLPICSLGTPASRLAGLADVVLPPLYHEALTDNLKLQLVDRIRHCFPFYQGTRERAEWTGELEVIELSDPQQAAEQQGGIACFSVDTAVEEHGPHLPLATDTIQSYGVLQRLAERHAGLHPVAPLEYGQLTWGLPFGLSVDITAPLLTEYVCNFARAISQWTACDALYVVDVHGSIVHRTAIVDGLKQHGSVPFRFRWLHDSLVEFAGDRGDQHAGGVETVLVELINDQLLDERFWPDRMDELAAGQMDMQRAIDLSGNLADFIAAVEQSQSTPLPLNGIVGDIHNARQLDATAMMERMLAVAESDLDELTVDH